MEPANKGQACEAGSVDNHPDGAMARRTYEMRAATELSLITSGDVPEIAV